VLKHLIIKGGRKLFFDRFFDATMLDFTQPKTQSIASLLVGCRFNH